MFLSSILLLSMFVTCISANAKRNLPSLYSNKGEINAPIEDWGNNEFFGLNLDKSNQVVEFHKLLVSGKLYWQGTKLEEWTDGFISDYDLSDGQISSTCIFKGSAQDTQSLFAQLHNIFYSRYNNCKPLKQKEWIDQGNGSYSITCIDFYDYKGYRIGVTMVLESNKKDKTAVYAGSIRLGLGALY